jgi:diacylglycerol kinase (ATP)
MRSVRLPAFRKPVLIYNPTAGKLKRDDGRVLRQVLDALAMHAGMNPELAPTTGPGTAGGLAASHIQNGADLILAFGGDGTVNEIAAGMVGSTVPLAVLPGGTANVFDRQESWPSGSRTGLP